MSAADGRKKIGYTQTIPAAMLSDAAFDARAHVDRDAEEAAQRFAEQEGLVIVTWHRRQEIPLVFVHDPDPEQSFIRPAEEGEEPDSYEFRYLWLATEKAS